MRPKGWVALVVAVAGLLSVGLSARWLALRVPAQPEPIVGFNEDPTLVGKWAVVWPDGLVLGISEPFDKYPQLGAPTFTVTAVNYGTNPVTIGPEHFRAMVGGQAYRFEDGEPSFGSHPVAPGSFRRGRITYYGYGQPVEKLVVARGPYRAEVDLSRQDYPHVTSVLEAIRGQRR